MISFHPTISFTSFLKALFVRNTANKELSRIFPSHTITIVDSGRGALAHSLETLNLRGKRLALPAYLCDVLLPIIEHYEITPIFLDIDKDTFQPPLGAYKKNIGSIDAALLVRTFGRSLNREAIGYLKSHDKVIIEDYAHISVFEQKPLEGDARIYSLPKQLPLHEGGLLITRDEPLKQHFPVSPLTLTYIKNVLKLFAPTAFLIARVRNITKGEGSFGATWEKIRQPRKLTRKLLSFHLQENNRQYTPYCHPLMTRDPNALQEKLLGEGIIAERLWRKPITSHSDSKKDINDFPNTKEVSEHILCIPLWHTRTQEERDTFIRELEEKFSTHF